MKVIDDSTRRRVVAFLVLALGALIGRLITSTLGAPATVSRGLYLLGLGSLVAAVLVVATD